MTFDSWKCEITWPGVPGPSAPTWYELLTLKTCCYSATHCELHWKQPMSNCPIKTWWHKEWQILQHTTRAPSTWSKNVCHPASFQPDVALPSSQTVQPRQSPSCWGQLFKGLAQGLESFFGFRILPWERAAYVNHMPHIPAAGVLALVWVDS